MKKERLFPYWTDLKRVIPVAQTQSVKNFTLTLVSIETYAVYGFLLTVNVEAKGLGLPTDRAGRGWVRASIVDQNGEHFHSMPAMISGVDSGVFRGRAVLICMPPLADQATEVLITIDTIEWEFTDNDAALPASEVVHGPWVFHVPL
jgi:hypothetical protein